MSPVLLLGSYFPRIYSHYYRQEVRLWSTSLNLCLNETSRLQGTILKIVHQY